MTRSIIALSQFCDFPLPFNKVIATDCRCESFWGVRHISRNMENAVLLPSLRVSQEQVMLRYYSWLSYFYINLFESMVISMVKILFCYWFRCFQCFRVITIYPRGYFYSLMVWLTFAAYCKVKKIIACLKTFLDKKYLYH